MSPSSGSQQRNLRQNHISTFFHFLSRSPSFSPRSVWPWRWFKSAVPFWILKGSISREGRTRRDGARSHVTYRGASATGFLSLPSSPWEFLQLSEMPEYSLANIFYNLFINSTKCVPNIVLKIERLRRERKNRHLDSRNLVIYLYSPGWQVSQKKIFSRYWMSVISQVVFIEHMSPLRTVSPSIFTTALCSRH